MKVPQPVLTGILSIGLLAAPLAGAAQPALEQSRVRSAQAVPQGHLPVGVLGENPCVVPGGTSGPDPAAYRDALQAVKALVGPEARPSP